MIEITEDTKFYKIKYRDGKKLKIVNNVISIEKSFGDVQNIYNICGIHPLFGPSYCDKCKEKNNKDGCGEWFIECSIQCESDVIIANTLNGQVVITDDWDLVE